MSESSLSIATRYRAQGFVHLPGFFDAHHLTALHAAVQRFHAAWMAENSELYRAGAVNSAYLTSPRHLAPADREQLFRFVAQNSVGEVLDQIFAGPAAFMNTQLFFNPADIAQRNYWHRDIQYTGMSVEEQQRALGKQQCGTPARGAAAGAWSRSGSGHALALGHAGRVCRSHATRRTHKRSDALAGTQQLALQTGDLLVFSANMLHRGLYGMDRLAFDMLFCDPDPALLAYVQQDCLPDAGTLATVACPQLYLRAQRSAESAP
jgi:hypothetical protein